MAEDLVHRLEPGGHLADGTVCGDRELRRRRGDQDGVAELGLQGGQVLAAPKSITPHSEFEAEVYVLTKEEGGRHSPFFNGYRPQFYFRTTDVTGKIELQGGAEMCMPGDNVQMKIDLGEKPIAMEEGLSFAVREGGRTVGAGVVTKILK